MDHFLSLSRQVLILSIALIGGAVTDLAASNLDLFDSSPIRGNQALLTLVGGSLGGAFMSAFVGKQTSSSIRVWAFRMFIATLTGIVFSPFLISISHLTPNAATVLALSAIVALCFKIVIKWAHDRLNYYLKTKPEPSDYNNTIQ